MNKNILKMLPVNTRVFKNGEIGLQKRRKIRERSPMSKLKRKVKRLKKQMNHLEMSWHDSNWRKGLFPTQGEQHDRWGTTPEEVFLDVAFPQIAFGLTAAKDLLGLAQPHTDNGEDFGGEDRTVPSATINEKVKESVRDWDRAAESEWHHPSQALSHKVPSAVDVREEHLVRKRPLNPDERVKEGVRDGDLARQRFREKVRRATELKWARPRHSHVSADQTPEHPQAHQTALVRKRPLNPDERVKEGVRDGDLARQRFREKVRRATELKWARPRHSRVSADQTPEHPQAPPTAIRGPQQVVHSGGPPPNEYVTAEMRRLTRLARPVSAVPPLSNCPPRADLLQTPSATVAAGAPAPEAQNPMHTPHSQVAIL
jgi:hypothetical protein